MTTSSKVKSLTEKIKVFPEKDTLIIEALGSISNLNCEDILQNIQDRLSPKIKTIKFIADNLKEWDSSFLVIIYDTIRLAKVQKLEYDLTKLPDNIRALIDLAFAVNRKPSKKMPEKRGIIEETGYQTITMFEQIKRVLKYIKEVLISMGRFISAKSIMRGIDFCSSLEDCGPKAIGIVSLISFLVGLILAFVGAVQLQTFGAQIYVASLVTIGMCRIMGAIMVGIIMAGRTGSSYAATIGTMQVNEELDALETMGLSKIDFLVLPRLLSLLLAMPILTMLADAMGIIGGAFIGVFLMNLPYQEYWKYAIDAFTLSNFLVGVFHGFCFGFIISLCGCYSGLTCGRNADSVGIATTRSVVNAIVWMIVVTGIITVICQELGL